MEIANIILGSEVIVDSTTSLNNIKLGDKVKIAKYCSAFGSKSNILEIGSESYIGMFSILNGYAAKLTIGSCVSIAQNVNIMTDSGPNASLFMQKHYPIIKGPVTIEDHVWIGAGVVITPNVKIGRCSIVASNSFVSTDIPPYCLYGGSPAKLIKKLTQIQSDDPKKV